MKPYFLTSKIFPFINNTKQETLPVSQIKRLGLLYSSYRSIISSFLFVSSYWVAFSNTPSPVPLPSLQQRSTLLFYALFSLLLVAFFLVIRSNYSAQLFLGLIFDVLVLSILLYLSGTADIQLTMLYMVVVAVSFMLLASYQAVIVTMLAILSVIYQQFFNAITHNISVNSLGEALLLSISFICVGFLSWSISQRLIKVEKIALDNADQINKLNAITQEVIRTMHQGVLVLDSNKNIMISNHATNIMLGLNATNNHVAYHSKHGSVYSNVLNINEIQSNNYLIRDTIIKKHPSLIKWFDSVPSNRQSQLIYQLPNPTIKLDKLRITINPMPDDIMLILIEDLRREQTNAQQLKLASLGQLTASIAHEIRNPLATISQASQLLIEDSMSDEKLKEVDPNLEFYTMIFNQTKRVNRIIEDVLKLSRQAKPEQTKLNLIQWLSEFIMNHYQDSNVVFLPSCEANVYFDPNQLEQILINLVNNGLKFSNETPAGAFVEIEVFCQENDVILDILDQGTGVDADKQDNLFMPFFTTNHEGTGLGLYLSQAFAEANLARLIYVPEHPKTCFRIIIPRAINPSDVNE